MATATITKRDLEVIQSLVNLETHRTLGEFNNLVVTVANETNIEQRVIRSHLAHCSRIIRDYYIVVDLSDVNPSHTYKLIKTQILQNTRIRDTFDRLCRLTMPEQKSQEWFALREGVVSASDVGCVLGDSKYDQPYTFLIKKVERPRFESNAACYHGSKYERIAITVYETRRNVTVRDFGLIRHATRDHVAASPDGIVDYFCRDGTAESGCVGTMLEIKCPAMRRIKHEGVIRGEICPLHYWDQIQIQLEVCDLERCDFSQYTIVEYPTRREFIDDSDYKYERGCIIQVMPASAIHVTAQDIYESAKWIYPQIILATPDECDVWIAETMSDWNHHAPRGYVFHSVLYWKLVDTHTCAVMRDREWFESVYPRICAMWSYVMFLRTHAAVANEYFAYVHHLQRTSTPAKINKAAMSAIERLYNSDDPESEMKLICSC